MADYEAHNEPENLPVVADLSNYLINPTKKGDNSNFLCNVLEDNNKADIGYDSDNNTAEFTVIAF